MTADMSPKANERRRPAHVGCRSHWASTPTANGCWPMRTSWTGRQKHWNGRLIIKRPPHRRCSAQAMATTNDNTLSDNSSSSKVKLHPATTRAPSKP